MAKRQIIAEKSRNNETNQGMMMLLMTRDIIKSEAKPLLIQNGRETVYIPKKRERGRKSKRGRVTGRARGKGRAGGREGGRVRGGVRGRVRGKGRGRGK